MTILSSTRRVLKSGRVDGTITVQDGRRKHRVRYERDARGHTEQWGAPTHVLCATYLTFERLTSPDPQ